MSEIKDSKEDLVDMIMSLFSQACQISYSEKDGPKYDHMCTYEYEQDKLIEWGKIKKKECVRE